MHRRSVVISLFLALSLETVYSQTPVAPKPPFTAGDLELGRKLAARTHEIFSAPNRGTTRFNPYEPFKILGNLYFVGIFNGEAFLLTSPQGHILFGTGYPATPQLIEKNIETLGFKMSEVKIILVSYWHWDNAGGSAYLKEKTGARLMAGANDIPFLERGGDYLTPPPQTPPAGTGGFAVNTYPPVKVDRALLNGDVVKLGPLSVNAYNLPGHTPGAMAWTFTVRQGNRDYKVLHQAPTFAVDTPTNISQQPGYSEAAVLRSFETLRSLLPVDVYLAAPAFGFWMEDRVARLKAGDSMAFVDRSILPAMIAVREVEFDEQFKKAKAAK